MASKTKLEVIDSANKVAMLSFGAYKTPDIIKSNQFEYIKWGKKNDFPQELIRYFNDHAEHSAIVSAKAKFLSGEGLKIKNAEQEVIGKKFLDSANRFEDWNDLFSKICLDVELFNSAYIQVISDLQGNPLEYLHLQYANCRLSECATKLYYSEDWNAKLYELKYKCYPLFKKGNIGTSFIRYKVYQPSKDKLSSLYPLPPYKGCLTEIKSDIDISTFDANLVLNGFSAGTIITFFNGEPTPEEKRAIRAQINGIHSSPENAGSIVVNYAQKGGDAAKIEAIASDDLANKFESIQKRYQSKILIGHNVTNPEIFGVKTEGSSLGNRVSIRESYELMLNTYTKPRQNNLLSWLENICYLSTGLWIEFEINQLDPIGFDLINDPDLTQDERRKIKGHEPLLAPKLDANGVEIKESEVNNTLTNLTGRQFQGLMRIVTKFDNGKLSKESAVALMVSGFGLTKEDALTFLNENDNVEDTPVKMSNQKNATDFLITYLSNLEKDSDLELELVSEEDVHIHNNKQAVEFETIQKLKFADVKKKGFLDNLVSGIKGLIGIPETTTTEPIEEGDKYKTEIITKYRYALKEGIDYSTNPNRISKDLLSTSHDFCKKMIGLDREFTFEQLDKARVAGLSNGFPEVDNIWDFRGGFTTEKGTGIVNPFCNHIWKAKTYKVKTKI
jgi:hypothetical protein